jgi:predicted nucleic acid-binding protein
LTEKIFHGIIPIEVEQIMKIYLDNCCYNRPFDSQDQITVEKETARNIIKTGIKEKDAVHVACAIYANCDCFLTVDKRLLKYKTDKLKMMNPIEFVKNWEKNNV